VKITIEILHEKGKKWVLVQSDKDIPYKDRKNHVYLEVSCDDVELLETWNHS